jgi:thiol-disulfide isomerase/thioredoxin
MKRTSGKKLSLIIATIIGMLVLGLNSVEGSHKKSDSEHSGGADKSTELVHIPPFAVEDTNGQPISSSTLNGKVALLDFWATWCAPCRQEIPHFNKLYAKYRDRGFVIVGLSLDKYKATVTTFRRRTPIDYPIALASKETQQQFGGINVYPTAFLVDRDGRIIKKYLGFSYPEEFEEDVRPLLETQDDQAKKDRVVKTVEKLAEALQTDNHEAFMKYIGDAPTPPAEELWKSGKGLIEKFGKIKRLEFSEFDAEGAFIKVEFERATREIFVRIDANGKFIEVSYVPPKTQDY